MLREGDVAPDFTAPDQDGNSVTLSALRGQPVVLYFYPKDDTPGCTTQACGLRDSIGELKQRGAVVLGVSGDSVKSHRKFADKYGLPFTLVSDQDHAIGKAYAVFKHKTMFGKDVGYYERTTYVIDAQGKLKKIFPKVSPEQHVDLLLEVI